MERKSMAEVFIFASPELLPRTRKTLLSVAWTVLSIAAPLAGFLSMAGCKPELAHEKKEVVPVFWHQAAGVADGEFSEKSLKDSFPASSVERDELVQRVMIHGIDISFYNKADSLEDLRRKLGCGSFDEWKKALGLGEADVSILREPGKFSEALVAPADKLHVIRSGRFPTMVVVSRRSDFSGRIWDLEQGKTWAIQGSYGSGPDEAALAIELLRGIIPP